MNNLILSKTKIIYIAIIVIIIVLSNLFTYHYCSANENYTSKVVTDTLYIKDSTNIKVLKDSLNILHSIKSTAKLHIIYKHDTLGNTSITFDSTSTYADTLRLIITKYDSLYVHDTVYTKDSTYSEKTIYKAKKINIGLNTFIDKNKNYGINGSIKYKIFDPVYVGITAYNKDFKNNWNFSAELGLSINF
jgi:hypothetical protein